MQLYVNMKDVNDNWILDGVFIFFLMFIFSYTAIMTFSSKVSLVAIFTSIFVAVIVLIPNLKYSFVYGYHDPLMHYGFVKELISLGHVPSEGFYASQYENAAGSHIAVSMVSIITGLDVILSMKTFIIVSLYIFPLMVYFMLKIMEINENLSRTVIFASTISLQSMYIFTGTNAIFVSLCMFFYFWLLLANGKLNNHSGVIIIILSAIRIIISHDVTSFFVLACLFLILMLNYLFKALKRPVFYSNIIQSLSILIIISIAAHFVFAAEQNLITLIRLLKDTINSLIAGSPPVALKFYQGFFKLTLFEKFQVLTVRFIQSAILLFLSCLTPFAVRRLRRTGHNLNLNFYYSLIFPVLIALLFFFIPLFIRPIMYRGLIYFSLFSPFLVGTTIFWFVYGNGFNYQKIRLFIIIFLLIMISIIQLYPCQPLLPKVSTKYGTYYAIDLRQVSSTYTRAAIRFTSIYNYKLNVWSDLITRGEIYALTRPSFQSLLTWHSDRSHLLIITHVGRAHIIPSASDAFVNEQYLRSALNKINVVYNNGESYIFLNMTNYIIETSD